MKRITSLKSPIKPNYGEARSQLNWQTPQFLSHPANVSTSEPRAAFWEKTKCECLNHHLDLLHLMGTAPKTARKSPESLDVHKATVDRAQRSFVLVKVVPVRVLSENGNAITAYGLLDSAAASSSITSDLAQKLQLEGVPEKVSINTVTHSSHACELSRVEFKIGPVDRNVSSFSVCHGLTVEDLNRSNQYCPNQIDLK